MTGLLFNSAGIPIRGWNAGDDFTYSITETPVGTPGSSTNSNVNDVVMSSVTTTGSINNAQVKVSQSLQNSNKDLIFKALTPNFATIDSSGNISWVADGVASFSVRSGGIERSFTRSMAHTGSITTTTIANYRNDAPGNAGAPSLGRHVFDAVTALISGKTAQGNTLGPGGIQNLWSSNNLNPSSPSAVRNPGFFAPGFDWGPIAAITTHNGNGVNNHPALLVTNQHIFGANHYHPGQFDSGAPAVGQRVVFISSTGSIETATIAASWSDSNSDHWIAYLSNKISSAIPPLKIMPSGWKSYVKSLDSAVGNTIGGIPVLCKVMHASGGASYQDDRVTIMDLQRIDSGHSPMAYISVFNPPSSSFHSWSSPVVGGDSGGPILMPVNGSLVLLAAFWRTSGGISIEADATNLETQMRSLAMLASGNTDTFAYSFTRANLSGFTVYP